MWSLGGSSFCLPFSVWHLFLLSHNISSYSAQIGAAIARIRSLQTYVHWPGKGRLSLCKQGRKSFPEASSRIPHSHWPEPSHMWTPSCAEFWKVHKWHFHTLRWEMASICKEGKERKSQSYWVGNYQWCSQHLKVLSKQVMGLRLHSAFYYSRSPCFFHFTVHHLHPLLSTTPFPSHPPGCFRHSKLTLYIISKHSRHWFNSDRIT